MFGKLNTTEIDQLIASQLVGRIGCHGDGITYVIPVSYAYDGTYLYVYSFRGKKIDIMRKNPKVCFQVDDTKDLANWRSVICWGEFEELLEEADKAGALQKLTTRKLPVLSSDTMHITTEWPFSGDKLQHKDGIFFRIRITDKTGRFEKIDATEFYGT